MYYSGKRWGHELGLSACFRQWRAQSHCRYLHGYPLAFEALFRAETLDANNWVQDFGSLKPVKAYLEQLFDHKLIVAYDDPQGDYISSLAGLDVADVVILPQVGCEAFAQHVFEWIEKWLKEQETSYVPGTYHLAQRVQLQWVKCQEHAGNWAMYSKGTI
jgi:6-pyruvoyltetrahydropterin/6-carboxytetrahydropterin synthase